MDSKTFKKNREAKLARREKIAELRKQIAELAKELGPFDKHESEHLSSALTSLDSAVQEEPAHTGFRL